MAELIRMPKMSDTMEQGTILRWLKKVGDLVESGDILAEVETDKATMELEAYQSGTLLHIGLPEKAVAKVDALIAIIGEAGEEVAPLLAGEVVGPTPSQRDKATIAPTPPAPTPLPTEAKRHMAVSPLAKKVAQGAGVALAQLQGSGPQGRIVHADVQAWLAAQPAPGARPAVSGHGEVSYCEILPSARQQKVAEVLSASKGEIPHFYLNQNLEMDGVLALRSAINEASESKISINDCLIKGVALALVRHPEVNATWVAGKIRHYKAAHVGVAMAIENELWVPVIPFADRESLHAIGQQVQVLRCGAEEGKFPPQPTATFTLSNLGMLGIPSFSAIINPPAACILAIGAVEKQPVVKENQVVVASVMRVTLSCDHRVVNGATAACFLATLKGYLETPLRLLL